MTAPSDSPVSPKKPLGTSTETIGRPRVGDLPEQACDPHLSMRRRPDRSRTTHRRRDRPPRTSAPRAASTPAVQRLAWSRASPRKLLHRSGQCDRTGPAGSGERAPDDEAIAAVIAGSPKPRWAACDQRRVISRATASPSCCMSSIPGCRSATVRRSASFICATRSSAVVIRRRAPIGGALPSRCPSPTTSSPSFGPPRGRETPPARSPARERRPLDTLRLSSRRQPRQLQLVQKIGATMLLTVGNDEAVQASMCFTRMPAHQLSAPRGGVFAAVLSRLGGSSRTAR